MIVIVVVIEIDPLGQGYLNNTQATRDAITPDGWFKTGDVAVRDEEGFYKIVDRRKELIKYKVRIRASDRKSF